MKKHDDDTIAYCLKNGITYNAFGVMRGCLFTDPTVAALAKKYKTSAAQASHASHTRRLLLLRLLLLRLLPLLLLLLLVNRRLAAPSRSFRLCVC